MKSYRDNPGSLEKRMRSGQPVGYFIHIQRRRGPVMLWTGHSFSNDEKPMPFQSEEAALHKAQSILAKHAGLLEGYRVYVASRPQGEFSETRKNPGRRRHSAAWDRCVRDVKRRGTAIDPYAVCTAAMGKKSFRSNPVRRRKLDVAAKKLEDFTGHEAARVVRAPPRSEEKTGLVIGELDLIGYRARRDGRIQRYGHRFRTRSRPLLAVSTDGKQLHVVGGRYEFTDAGIEDR